MFPAEFHQCDGLAAHCTAAKARQGNHSENCLQNLLYEAFCHLVILMPDEDACDVLVLLEGLPEGRVVSLPAGGGAEVGALPAEHLDHARQLPLHAQLQRSLAEASPEKCKGLG